MSNTTRIRVRPVQRVHRLHRVSLDATESVPLGVLFGGSRGVTLLRAAMTAMPGTLRQPDFAEARAWLAWQKQPAQALGEDTYQLVLEGARLHPNLHAAGCQRVEIALTITPSAAKVRRRANFTSGVAPKTAEAEEGLARTCNRAINTLGAFAYTIPLMKANIAEKVTQKLAPKHTVQQTVQQRAGVQRTRERQIAFQRVAVAPNTLVQTL